MQQLRLFGLTLFIVSIFLGLAAVTTQTKEIQLYDRRADGGQPLEDPNDPNEVQSLQFISVPIVWPLLASSGLGLVLWFGTAPREQLSKRRRSKVRRKKV